MRGPSGTVVVAASPLVLAGALSMLSNPLPLALTDVAVSLLGVGLIIALLRRTWSTALLPVSGYVGLVVVANVAAVSIYARYPGWLVMTNWELVVLAGVLAAGLDAPRPRWAEVVMTAAVVVVAAAMPMVVAVDPGSDLVLGLLVVVATVVAIAVGLQVRAHRLRLDDARRMAIGEVRRAMAGELHDVVAHEVTGIVVLAQAAGAGVPGPDGEAFRSIEEAGARALGEIRTLVAALQDDEGGALQPAVRSAAALRDTVAAFAATMSARTEVVVDDELDGCTSPVRLAVHRIIAEGLTNVRRHAVDAGHVRVRAAVGGDPARVHVQVDNDRPGGGAGPIPAGAGAGNGIGLDALAERCRLLGGELEAGPRPDGRWSVTATLPVGGPGEAER